MYVISFNLQNHPIRLVLLLSTFIDEATGMQTNKVITPCIKCLVRLPLRFDVDSTDLSLEHLVTGEWSRGYVSQQ